MVFETTRKPYAEDISDETGAQLPSLQQCAAAQLQKRKLQILARVDPEVKGALEAAFNKLKAEAAAQSCTLCVGRASMLGSEVIIPQSCFSRGGGGCERSGPAQHPDQYAGISSNTILPCGASGCQSLVRLCANEGGIETSVVAGECLVDHAGVTFRTEGRSLLDKMPLDPIREQLPAFDGELIDPNQEF